MPTIPRSSQKRILRLISARADIDYCQLAYQAYSRAPDDDLRYHLFQSFVVSYGRPFTNNHGIGSLTCEYPDFPDYADASMNDRHQRLIDLRHNFVSHSSIQGSRAFILTPGSINPSTKMTEHRYWYAVQKLNFHRNADFVAWLFEVVNSLAQRLEEDIAITTRELGLAHISLGETAEIDTGAAPFRWSPSRR